MTREQRLEIAEKYGWQPGEREAMQRDQAERAEREDRIARDKLLAWCEHRNQQRRESERAAGQPPQRNRTNNMPNSDELWNAWADAKIRAALQASDKSTLAAVGDVLI